MTKQEALYVTDKYHTHEGKRLHIRFSEEYYDSVPRPTKDDRELLKQSILEDGLTDEIKINNNGVVLDGHTRMEICEEIGWRNRDNGMIITPRYLVKEFKTSDLEREYVIKTNLMRRQLNAFQKVRLIANLYNNNVHSRREQTRFDIMKALQKFGKPMNSTMIAKEIGLHRTHILKVLRGLKEDFCVNYKEKYERLDSTKQPVHYYHLLPKAEEILSKGRPKPVILKELGKIIGVGRDNTSKSIFLINHANAHLLARLETGEIGILSAYEKVTKQPKIKRVMRKGYLRGRSKVICPHCELVSRKDEWKIYVDGK